MRRRRVRAPAGPWAGTAPTVSRPQGRLRPARFWFDGAPEVAGYSDGSTWNGWGRPYFDDKQLDDARDMLEGIGYRTIRRTGPLGQRVRIRHEDDLEWTTYDPTIIDGRRFWLIDGLSWNMTLDRKRGGRVRTEASPRRLRESGLRVPGWHIGWNSEIGAEAASTGAATNVLIVATGEDGAPKNLDEPVTVGLFRLGDGEWEELGVQLEFDTFEDAVRLGAKELERQLVRAERG